MPDPHSANMSIDPLIVHAHNVKRASAALARHMREDIELRPAPVLEPLVLALGNLRDTADEISKAAISVNPDAAAEANTAADLLNQAALALVRIQVRLANQP